MIAKNYHDLLLANHLTLTSIQIGPHSQHVHVWLESAAGTRHIGDVLKKGRMACDALEEALLAALKDAGITP